MVTARIVLEGWHVYETQCESNDPLLSTLREALALRAANTSEIVQIELRQNGKSFGLAFPASSIISVETDPPHILEMAAPESEIVQEPHLRIPNFLTDEENQRVLDFALAQESKFESSGVDTNEPDYRHSLVFFGLETLGIDFAARVREIVPDVLKKFNIEEPGAYTIETQLTAHNDGDFFRMHPDSGSAYTSNRILTYVYYFHKKPRAFTGGSIRLYDSLMEGSHREAAETFVDVEPHNNSILFFPSYVLHEVLPIRCPSRAFADGRFTLNGWVLDDSIQVEQFAKEEASEESVAG